MTKAEQTKVEFRDDRGKESRCSRGLCPFGLEGVELGFAEHLKNFGGGILMDPGLLLKSYWHNDQGHFSSAANSAMDLQLHFPAQNLLPPLVPFILSLVGMLMVSGYKDSVCRPRSLGGGKQLCCPIL